MKGPQLLDSSRNLIFLGICAGIVYAAQIVCGMYVTRLNQMYPIGWSTNTTNTTGPAGNNLQGAQADAMFQYTAFMGSAAVAVLVIWLIPKVKHAAGRLGIAMITNIAVVIGYYTLGYNVFTFQTFLGVRYGLINVGGGMLFGATAQYITAEIARLGLSTVGQFALVSIWSAPMNVVTQPAKVKKAMWEIIWRFMGPAVWNMMIAPLLALFFLLTMYDTVMGNADGLYTAYMVIALATAFSALLLIGTFFSVKSVFLESPDLQLPKNANSRVVFCLSVIAFLLSRATFFVCFVYIPAQMLGAGCSFFDAKLAVMCLAIGMFAGRLICEMCFAFSLNFSHIVAVLMFAASAIGFGLLSETDQYTCAAARSQGMAFLLTFGISYVGCWLTLLVSVSAIPTMSYEFVFIVLAVCDAIGPILAQAIVWAVTDSGSRNYRTLWLSMLGFTGASLVVALITLIVCMCYVKSSKVSSGSYSSMSGKTASRSERSMSGRSSSIE